MNLASIGGSSMLQQMQQAMFSKADANGDGQLSNDEFLSIGQNMQGGGKSDAARPMRGPGMGGGNFGSETMGSLLSMQERAAEIYAGADADGDGSLTVEELATDMAAHAPPGMGGVDSSEMAANFLSSADADGDGALSEDEFKAARPPAPPSSSGASASATGSEEEETYDPLDTNEDGAVSMSELLASLQSAESKATGFSTEVSDLLQQLLDKLTAQTTSTVEAAA
jgi:Ca2+-binding EF-hand superfamily protein